MKIIYSTVFLLLFSFFSFGQSHSDQILGKWESEAKDGHIKIYKIENKYYGKLIWLKEPNDENGNQQLDKENPKENLQSRSLMNLVILKNLNYIDGEWTNGTVYDPNNGKTYTCTIWLEDGNLLLRGYWGWFFATETWTKIN